MEPNDRLQDLINVCERMSTILDQENRALRAREIDAIEEHLKEKDQLSRIYEKHMRAIQLKPEIVKEADADLRDTLKDVGEQMEEMLEENARALKMAMEINRRVLMQVAEAAKEHTPTSGTYSDQGSVGYDGNTYSPVSFNRTL